MGLIPIQNSPFKILRERSSVLKNQDSTKRNYKQRRTIPLGKFQKIIQKINYPMSESKEDDQILASSGSPALI